jgi:hypothetical protein
MKLFAALLLILAAPAFGQEPWDLTATDTVTGPGFDGTLSLFVAATNVDGTWVLDQASWNLTQASSLVWSESFSGLQGLSDNGFGGPDTAMWGTPSNGVLMPYAAGVPTSADLSYSDGGADWLSMGPDGLSLGFSDGNCESATVCGMTATGTGVAWNVTLDPPAAPELSPGGAWGALLLLGGVLAVLRGGRPHGDARQAPAICIAGSSWEA